MSMIHNDDSNGEVIDGLNGEVCDGPKVNYGEIDNIIDLRDCPVESVEGDGNDWSNFPPIYCDGFMGFYPSNFSNEYANKAPSRNHNAQVKSEPKEQVDSVVSDDDNTRDRDGVNTSRQNVISPETSASQIRSPISVLESSGACSSGRRIPTRFGMFIPVRARSKRGRPSSDNSWYMNSPIACAASAAKKSPSSIKGKKRPRTTELSIAPEGLNGSLQQVMKILPEDVNHTEKKVISKQQSSGAKRCTHCHVTKTPQWREGPLGKNTLCNACGVRYRSGRLYPEYRPAASPTFTPSLHSNSHRKVIEMRGKVIQETVLVENPMSSLSESVPMSSYLFDDSML